ncbi:hypothetical protein [Halpernia frigidisoli]|uniref:DNA-directed RNA polymerase n=1 Tax=Halpernia frigidisoli TaxID=1125876 RepID=A0A1I3FIG0_9FLAO|nr:hypothetical protein [Halpernia frigidisoli]SFI10989.1 hypothetical protein SAMN05443292_1404 [Halpernia frigidisoli]
MAKYYQPVNFIVPDNIDYNRIFGKIEEHLTARRIKKVKPKKVTPTQIKRVQEAIYLFLSYLYPDENFELKYGERSFWKGIISREFSDITDKLKTTVVDLLTDPKYPIIDENKSYQPNKYSKSYRLRLDFCIGGCPPRAVTIQSCISRNYLAKVTAQPLYFDHATVVGNEGFDYLLNQYDTSILTIDDEVDDFIKNYKELLDSKLSNLNRTDKKEWLTKKSEDKIKNLLSIVSKIRGGEFNEFVHKNNGRLYSLPTYCDEIIRKFIKIKDSRNLVEIDICNSHLYMLASILDKNFIYNKKDNFSLFKLKQNYFNILSNNLNESRFGRIIISNQIKYKSKSISLYNNSMLLYMLGIFDNNDINEYRSLPFSEGVYEFVDQTLFDGEKGRGYVKNSVMMLLNLKNQRNRNSFITTMSRRYPTVSDIIEMINGYKGDLRNLSTLLQRVESYLFLEVGIKNVLSEIPDLNFITVHDSIIVDESYANEIKEILCKSIKLVTGLPIGFKIKPILNPMDTIEKIVDESWLTMLKRYRKYRRDENKNRKECNRTKRSNTKKHTI